VIVRLDADGAVVLEADDCADLHLETPLDADGLRTALQTTGSGALESGADVAVLDLGVLRARARLAASAPDWPHRWERMVAAAGQRLTDDGLGIRVPVEPAG
jgi:hypothetical protein